MNATHTASQSYKTQDVKLPKTWDQRTDSDIGPHPDENRVFRPHISHVIDFRTAFQDGSRILEQISQNSINKLLRSLRMLKDTSDYFESFTKTELDHPDEPEYPDSPEDPESPDDPEGPEGADDPEGPEPWWPIKEEQQPEESS